MMKLKQITDGYITYSIPENSTIPQGFREVEQTLAKPADTKAKNKKGKKTK